MPLITTIDCTIVDTSKFEYVRILMKNWSIRTVLHGTLVFRGSILKVKPSLKRNIKIPITIKDKIKIALKNYKIIVYFLREILI